MVSGERAERAERAERGRKTILYKFVTLGVKYTNLKDLTVGNSTMFFGLY